MRLFIKKRSPCCVEMCVARDLVIRGDTLTFDRDEVEFMSRQVQIFTEEAQK
ncbi:MAG: hypothetical protein R8G66_31065 [Cytophagales bacterium]|nr:hypothetical protein [Cytophagales bacterium]